MGAVEWVCTGSNQSLSVTVFSSLPNVAAGGSSWSPNVVSSSLVTTEVLYGAARPPSPSVWLLLTVGPSPILRSLDGITFTAVTLPVGNLFLGAQGGYISGAGVWTVVGQGRDSVWHSSDTGLSWTLDSGAISLIGQGNCGVHAVSLATHVIAGSQSTSARILYRLDSVSTWSVATISSTFLTSVSGVAFSEANGIFVASCSTVTASASSVLVSSDGSLWTPVQNIVTQGQGGVSTRTVAWGMPGFVVGSDGQKGSSFTVSPRGDAYTVVAQTSEYGQMITSVHWSNANEKYVAASHVGVVQNKKVSFSTDGSLWTGIDMSPHFVVGNSTTPISCAGRSYYVDVMSGQATVSNPYQIDGGVLVAPSSNIAFAQSVQVSYTFETYGLLTFPSSSTVVISRDFVAGKNSLTTFVASAGPVSVGRAVQFDSTSSIRFIAPSSLPATYVLMNYTAMRGSSSVSPSVTATDITGGALDISISMTGSALSVTVLGPASGLSWRAIVGITVGCVAGGVLVVVAIVLITKAIISSRTAQMNQALRAPDRSMMDIPYKQF